MTIDMNKQYRTRDGRPVRILCVDRKDNAYPICGLVPFLNDPGEGLESWTEKGSYLSAKSVEHDKDLIEVRPRIKRTVWINVNSGGDPDVFISPVLAKHYASPRRIACIKVELDFEEGEGL